MTLITSVAILSLIVAACGESTSGGSRTAAGGTITVAYDEDVNGFNINQVEQILGRTPEMMGLVWPSVFVVQPNLKLRLNRELVTSAKLTNTSPQTVVYRINPKATWSDGTPITATDFIYNWQAQSGDPKYTDINGQPFQPAGTTGYSQIKSVTGSDDGKTVTLVFSSPFSDWQELFTYLMPAHIAQKVGFNSGFSNFGPAVQVSGGPYMVQSYTKGQDLVEIPNPHYWGPKPHLSKLVFRFIIDDAQQPPAVQNNEVQVVEPFQATLPYLESLKGIQGLTVKVVPGLQFAHIDFNEANPYLADVNIRHAIAYGTNREEIVKRVADPLDSSLKPLENRIFMPTTPQYQNTSGGYGDYDPAKAKQLLRQAGMNMGSDGYLHPTTGPEAGQDFSLSISTVAGQEARAQMEQLFQAQMKAIGVKINIQNYTSLPLASGAFDMVLFNWDASPFASSDEGIYCSYTNKAQCAANHDHYSDPTTDTLIQKAIGTTNSAESSKYWNEVDRQLWNDMVSLPLFQAPEVNAWSDHYANIEPNALEGIAWNAQDWAKKSS